MQSDSLALHPTPRSWTKPWSVPKIVDIELAYFKITKVDFVEAVFDLLQTDVFPTGNLADENAALVLTDVACIVHPSRVKMSRIDIGLLVAFGLHSCFVCSREDERCSFACAAEKQSKTTVTTLYPATSESPAMRKLKAKRLPDSPVPTTYSLAHLNGVMMDHGS
jgi:hypothetical protein